MQKNKTTTKILRRLGRVVSFYLRHGRCHKGWTLNEAAAAASLEPQMLQSLEDGQLSPTLSICDLVRVMGLYGLRVGFLFYNPFNFVEADLSHKEGC